MTPQEQKVVCQDSNSGNLHQTQSSLKRGITTSKKTINFVSSLQQGYLLYSDQEPNSFEWFVAVSYLNQSHECENAGVSFKNTL